MGFHTDEGSGSMSEFFIIIQFELFDYRKQSVFYQQIMNVEELNKSIAKSSLFSIYLA